ncbi:MAG: hypothetical protein IJH77_05720, partial [Mogibacterium sp.]|nr:hypothetical protein [Mogibacterium sp.]
WDENGLQVSTKGEDWKKAHDEGVKDALDGKKIAKDAVSGGTSGAIKEEKAIRSEKYEQYKKRLVKEDQKAAETRGPGRPKNATTEQGKRDQETLREMRKNGEYKKYQKEIKQEQTAKTAKSSAGAKDTAGSKTAAKTKEPERTPYRTTGKQMKKYKNENADVWKNNDKISAKKKNISKTVITTGGTVEKGIDTYNADGKDIVQEGYNEEEKNRIDDLINEGDAFKK